MRRRQVHWMFGLAATAFAVLAIAQAVRLERARHVNSAIAAATVTALDSSVPEARFARAIALDRAGDYDGAMLAYKALIQSDRTDLRRRALYNLGNLDMRAAMRDPESPSDQRLPLVELAKQSYRDLLREDPGDWDARYNLERALYLAPESEQDEADAAPPTPKEHAVSTVRATLELP